MPNRRGAIIDPPYNRERACGFSDGTAAREIPAA